MNIFIRTARDSRKKANDNHMSGDPRLKTTGLKGTCSLASRALSDTGE